MADRYEYRVGWRREHDRRQRRRLYQTEVAAERFAGFIQDPPPAEEYIMSLHSEQHLHSLGEAVEVVVERREVGEWEEFDSGQPTEA